LSNSDKKGIFPLTHVTQVYTDVHKDEEKPTQNIFRQAKAIHAFDYTHLVNEEQKYLKLNVGDYILVTGELKDANIQLRRTEFVGPQVGDELAIDGLKALAFVVVGIMIYLAIRFEWKFAVAAIIANLHDVVIILGFFAFFQWEFSLPVLAAVLAVLGYSVNESVVIFDRIRENFRRFRKMQTVEIIDNAITATISRTIITHGCTQLMVLSMLLFGGATLHYFALALTIGICFGIYSSVFVAAAIAMWLGIQREDLIKGQVVKVEGDSDDPNSGAVV
jgi:preprotein translocase subunit SecF